MDDVIKKYGDYKLYSFDIFDTLLGRLVGDPQGIFAIMQEKLQQETIYEALPYTLKRDFRFLRVYAESRARESIRNEKDEVTLEEIYTYIKDTYGLSTKEIFLLIELEIEVEELCSVPLPIVEDVKRLIELGKSVCFISDMYLSLDIIKGLLEKSEIQVERTQGIFLSSVYGETKSCGKLFDIVKKKLHIRVEEWLHVGDNKYSDIKMARAQGISTYWIRYREGDYFRKFLSYHYSTNPYVQLILGCSQLSSRTNSENSFLFSVAHRLAMPILVSYVEWILEQCQYKNIRNLYFIARDGYILKIIADRLIEFRDLSISTNYLYSSRLAWHISSKGEAERELLEKYIKQEINFDSEFALVDLFGSGKTINSLACHMYSVVRKQFRAFYFSSFSNKLPYLQKYEFCSHINQWDRIELFCKSPEGQCIGYQEKDNRVVPVCDIEMGEKIQEFGFDKYLAGVHSFMDYYVRTDRLNLPFKGLGTDIISSYLQYMKDFPDKDLREFLLNFPREKEEAKVIYNIDACRMLRNQVYKIKKLFNFIRYLKKRKFFYLIR